MTSEINLHALDLFFFYFLILVSAGFKPYNLGSRFTPSTTSFSQKCSFFQLLNNLFAPIKQRVANGDFIAPGTCTIKLFHCY